MPTQDGPIKPPVSLFEAGSGQAAVATTPLPAPLSEEELEAIRAKDAELAELRRKQVAQIKHDNYEVVLELANHLREARILASHLPPFRSLSVLGTNIEQSMLWLQNVWTEMNSSTEFLHRCVDPKLPTKFLLFGEPPLYFHVTSKAPTSNGPTGD